MLNYLGYSWVDMGRNLDRAKGMLHRAVELRPDDGFIVDSLGWVYFRLGEYEAAVEQLERAVELEPGDPVINDHLGDAYWRVGRQREARYQWQRALTLEPEDDTVADIEEKLRDGLPKPSGEEPRSRPEPRPAAMPRVEEQAPAKVNLDLRVTGRRPDGYHELDSVVAFAAWADRLTFAPARELTLELSGPFAAALAGQPTIWCCARRARLADRAGCPPRADHARQAHPGGGGLGGGSADAAATLRGLSPALAARGPSPDLLPLALELGADVPVCLLGGRRACAASASGSSRSSCPRWIWSWPTPNRAVPTAHVRRRLARSDRRASRSALPTGRADLLAWLRARGNDLEAPARRLLPVIGEVLEALGAQPGCRLARMSGSGATCFGVFDDAPAAARAARAIAGRARTGGWSAPRPARHDRAVHRFRARGPLHRAGQGGARPRRARGAGGRSVRRPAAVPPAARGLSARRVRRGLHGRRRDPGGGRPGVGGARAALALEADGRWYVGPDNGLFEIVLRRARAARCWRIEWQPAALSATFHGRDLFAPVARRLAQGEPPPGRAAAPTRYPDWPDDLAEIVYVDRYGNAMTGLRAALLPAGAELEAAGVRIARARTFGDVPPGGLCGTRMPTASPRSRRTAPARRRASASRRAARWSSTAPLPPDGCHVRRPPRLCSAQPWGVAKR